MKIILLLFVAATSTAFANPILELSGPTTPITVGETFDVNATITGVTDLYGWQADLNYMLTQPGSPQAADLSLLSITEGPFLATGGATFFDSGSDDPVAGTNSNIFDTLVGAPAGVSGDGILFTAEFQALSAGAVPISLSNVLLSDSNFDTIPYTGFDGSTNVIGAIDVVTVPEPRKMPLVLTAIFFLLIVMKRRAAGTAQELS